MTTLDKYICEIDSGMKLSTIGKLIKVLNISKFHQATVGEEQVNLSIRKTKNLPLYKQAESLSNVHWANRLSLVFWHAHNQYKNYLNSDEDLIQSIQDIEALQYKQGGFYKFHTDHYYKHPRTLSFILLLNNDYKGGELVFKDPVKEEFKTIKTAPGKLIVWPSNFLYPHTVKPVTEGTRYSVVAWGL